MGAALKQDAAAILAELQAALAAQLLVALATVVEARGASPARAGFKLLVREDGSWAGNVGGGALEQRVRADAAAALADGLGYQMQVVDVRAERGDQPQFDPATITPADDCGIMKGPAHALHYRRPGNDRGRDPGCPGLRWNCGAVRPVSKTSSRPARRAAC